MPSEAEYREQARFDERQAVKAERDALRAENERLRVQVEETAKECGIQKTENERLRDETTRLDALIDRGLYAEIERLRAALFKIADDSAHADQYVHWAQEALGRPKDG